MSSIGRIVGLPPGESQFALVRDEYGTSRTVHASELPEDGEIGEDMAYRVDVFHNQSGLATTLKDDPYKDYG